MSLAAPTNINLVQQKTSVIVNWSAVSGATYYVVSRFESAFTYADRTRLGTTTTTNFTDIAVPIIVESGNNFPQAVWSYYVQSADANGEYNSAGTTITMNPVTVTDVGSFDVSKPVLSDGTYYSINAIAKTSTDVETNQSSRDAVYIAHLKSIGA